MEKRLVDEYIALDKEFKKMEARKKELADAIKADMVATGLDRVEGTDGYIKLVVQPDSIVPAQEAKLRKGFSYIRAYR